jgi:hypothetical protein
MIAMLKNERGAFCFSFEMPKPWGDGEDDTIALPEVVLFAGKPFVLRGPQYNAHANRCELVYEQSTMYDLEI